MRNDANKTERERQGKAHEKSHGQICRWQWNHLWSCKRLFFRHPTWKCVCIRRWSVSFSDDLVREMTLSCVFVAISSWHCPFDFISVRSDWLCINDGISRTRNDARWTHFCHYWQQIWMVSMHIPRTKRPHINSLVFNRIDEDILQISGNPFDEVAWNAIYARRM